MPHLALRDEFLVANELVNFGAVAVKNWSPEDIFTADYFADTRLYPEWQKRKAQKFGLRIRIETTPNRDSRISLLASRDSNGMRRSRLDWRVNSVEFDSIRRITGLFGKNWERAAQEGFAQYMVRVVRFSTRIIWGPRACRPTPMSA